MKPLTLGGGNNCEDDSSLDFTSGVQYMKDFIFNYTRKENSFILVLVITFFFFFGLDFFVHLAKAMFTLAMQAQAHKSRKNNVSLYCGRDLNLCLRHT